MPLITNTTSSKRHGFTLLEMVVALGIFMVFITAVLNSFVSLTTTQQKANLSREGIAEAKEILHQISLEGREKRIDYSCTPKTSSELNLDSSNPTQLTENISFGVNCQVGDDTQLVLISNDGLERILISKNELSSEANNTFYEISALRQSRSNTLSLWFNENLTQLHSPNLKIRSFEITVTPGSDPYDLSNPEPIHHPIAQILLSVERNSKNPSVSSDPIVLQTSISSRAYNPQT